jgi:hypothetical protein
MFHVYEMLLHQKKNTVCPSPLCWKEDYPDKAEKKTGRSSVKINAIFVLVHVYSGKNC